MTAENTDATTEAERRRFRSTLLRVLFVQAVSLLLLWLLQARYSGS